MAEDERPKDDPARLLEEARKQVEDNAKALRSTKVPIETEPASTYRP